MAKDKKGQEQATGKDHTKCIKVVRSEKTGGYVFREAIVPNHKVKEFFDKKK